jgi:hypothetical protein
MELAIGSYGSHTAAPIEFIRRRPTLLLVPRNETKEKSMKALLNNLIKRKTIFALVLALTIFGAVYGFAATLNVGANTLSAGNASVASCETNTATGTYAVAYDTATTAYKVSGVTITGLDAACAGKAVSATITSDSGGTNLGTLTGIVPVGGGSLVLGAPTGTIGAASVSGVSVAING